MSIELFCVNKLIETHLSFVELDKLSNRSRFVIYCVGVTSKSEANHERISRHQSQAGRGGQSFGDSHTTEVIRG
jgi:hypothetical protein